jgi:tRNA-uridine 2-sulfurtransferase
MSNKPKKVFVGMSGGVDSSVTAMLLRDQGYDVVGVFMRCYNLDGCAEKDAEDARRVAEHLQIPFYVWDFENEYKERVVQYMIDGYRAGITPNPDVMCNREIKFGLFLENALAAGADYVATGHYVRIKSHENEASPGAERFSLWAAKDTAKDQSYFLWMLTQAQLTHCLFPIGGYIKTEVRAMAKKAGLPTAEKKDSQGICFLGQVSVADFLKQYIPERRGALLTTEGNHIGEHSGTEFYTIGQRHIDADFKFPKTGGAAKRKAFYVASKDAASNAVVVAEGSENPALYRKFVTLTQANFIDGQPLGGTRESGVFARVRYRQPLSSAKLSKLNAENYELTFDRPQKFIAPGQSAVWYSEEGEMLGGGVIL